MVQPLPSFNNRHDLVTTTAWIALGVFLTIIAGLILMREHIYVWAAMPPHLRRGHILGLFVLALAGPILSMVVGFIARERYAEQERRANITRAEVKRLAEPEVDDIIRLLRIFYRECSQKTRKGEECRRQYIQTITRIVRVRGNAIVPAPGGGPQPQQPSAPRSGPAGARGVGGTPGRDGVRGPRGFRGPSGPTGPQGAAGRAGADVNSAVVDGLDNRLAAVERGLGSLLQGLCAPAIARLLNLLRLCG